MWRRLVPKFEERRELQMPNTGTVVPKDTEDASASRPIMAGLN